MPILLTDTVGFIDNLPSWIIDAFHSTLEEIEVADVVVLVVDASEPKEVVAKKLRVSCDELCELGFSGSIVTALNKIDLISKNQIENLITFLQDQGLIKERWTVPISVKEEQTIEDLLGSIYEALPHIVKLQLKLPLSDAAQSFLSTLYRRTRVFQVHYNSWMIVDLECNANIKEKIISNCRDQNGIVIE